MSYDNPERYTYSFGNIDFGAGDEVTSLRGPAGKTGALKYVSVSATETFNEVTTEGRVDIGTAADPDQFAILNLGSLADTDTADSSTTDTDAILIEAIPADTQVEVTFVAPTGGTPAGMGDVNIVIEWW